jgi:quinol-cytochrome oxidoreductase complex cytochrome b subunit
LDDGCGDYRTKEETKNDRFATASFVFWFSSMKKLLMVLLVAGGAFIGYHYVVSGGPEAAYNSFSEEILHASTTRRRP